jgi:hypothetical protein
MAEMREFEQDRIRTYETTQYDVVVAKVKALLFITSSDYDTYLDAIIPMLLTQAEEYCHTYFSYDNPDYGEVDEPEYTMNIPNPVYMYLSKAVEVMIQQTGVTSEKQGERSVAFGNMAEELWATKFLNQYRRVDWKVYPDYVVYD